MALTIEKDVRARSLPFFDELAAARREVHDLENLAVHGRRARAEAQRQAEAGAGKAMLVVQVNKPEHAMLLAVEGLALHALLLADAGVLQLQHGRDRRAGTAQHIGTVPLTGRGVIKANFAASHVELLFPAQMPGAFAFAPAVAIARLVPPVLDVLRGHDGGEEPATILADGALALGDRLPLYAINPSIDHAIIPRALRYNVLTLVP